MDRFSFNRTICLTLNNLRMLQSQQSRMEESRRECEEAPKIDRKLAPKNPGTYLRNGARTLNNLRMLQSQQSRMEESRREYKEVPTKQPGTCLRGGAMKL